MLFGLHTGPQNISFEELIDIWQEAEQLGFDWISVWDHLYPTLGDGSVDGPNLDAVVALAALAQSTERVKISCLVFNVTMRHPSLLAHVACALSELSGGRLEIGLGAGWYEREQVDSGIAFPNPGVRVRMLEEAVAVVRGLLTEKTFSFEGKHFRLREALCEPKPRGRVPIWVGGFRPRVLSIAGRLADGFNVAYVSPSLWAAAKQRVREAAASVGRNPDEVRGSANVGLFFAEDRDEAARLCEKTMGPQVAAMGGHLLGTPDDVASRVAEYASAGVDQLNVVVRPPFDRRWLRLFASEVVPRFRS